MLAMAAQDIREKHDLSKMLDALVPGITARSHGLFPQVERSPKAARWRKKAGKISCGQPCSGRCAN